jgi:hypothetical protein
VATTIQPVGVDLLKPGLNPTLLDLAERISPDASGALSDPPNVGWLKGRLWGIGKESSKIIFQAYQLPVRDQAGGHFAPVKYGKPPTSYQIDHIIPSASLQDFPGRENGELLVNFCPITALDNRTFRELSAYEKLTGRYTTAQTSRHPYMVWLSDAQKQYDVVELDSPINLGEERVPPIGEARIDHLASVLRDRI